MSSSTTTSHKRGDMKDGGGWDRTADGSMQALSTICAIYMCFFIVATAVIAHRLQQEIAKSHRQPTHTDTQLYLDCTAAVTLESIFLKYSQFSLLDWSILHSVCHIVWLFNLSIRIQIYRHRRHF